MSTQCAGEMGGTYLIPVERICAFSGHCMTCVCTPCLECVQVCMFAPVRMIINWIHI